MSSRSVARKRRSGCWPRRCQIRARSAPPSENSSVYDAGESLLIGVITKVSIEIPTSTNERGYHSTADLDLVGEIKQPTTDQAQFQRGVTEYPAIGDPVLTIGTRELKLVFNPSGASTIEIGHLTQDSTIRAYVDVDDMLSKHFAVLGTTGVGKSSAVVLMLQEILRARPDLRIFVLDAHNEYGRPFGDQGARRQSTQSATAVLAVQLRGDRRRPVRGARRIGRGGLYSLRGDPAGQGHLQPVSRAGGSIAHQTRRSRARPLFPSTPPYPTGSRI